MKSTEIRKRFLDFFENKSHKIVPSAPMVLKGDPSLMFTNAGMNQFKEFFLGNSTPKHHQIADTQKCLRVSGKHNDLEEVGKDTYHHTMFEMLGNWSIGNPSDASVGYFKKEAIKWAWEFLTEELKIDKSSLYVTVFEGDQSDGISKDVEAYKIWEEIVDEDKILLGNKKDNFWEMGEQGPCGPASEIHVDIRSSEEKAKIPGRDLVNQDHPQVVEIWNLVFIQYNRLANGKLVELPAKHIDTGMGFERLSMVMQNVQSNYDTDIFKPLLSEIETITGYAYGKNEATDIAMRVIADHVRAVTFAIADGQLPSSNGAGYVIRRILRRAIRYGFTFLNTKDAFIFKLVKVLVFQMGDAFPELKKQQTLCENVIQEEENSFLRTLAQGLSLLDQMIEKNNEKVLPGEKAFELYDTYGFPIDLTSLILEEKGMTLDEDAFQDALQAQKNRSKKAAASQTGDWNVLLESESEEFVGYDQLKAEVKLVKYRKIVSKKDGELYQLVFNKTPFYPEGGGQVGDKGYVESENGNVTYIIDTKKENNLIIHFAKQLPQQIEKDFTAIVDQKYRQQTARNHTATHLLHQALRTVLGEHVEQKGSLVNNNYLRFDFSHFSKMSEDELKQVEGFVNARIQEQLPLQENRKVSYKKALENGAIALFGEKYGDEVRTITFGKSTELCGGTHVENTTELWHFIITQETSVASGIRRIEAITSDAAKSYLTDKANAFNELRKMLNNSNEPQKVLQNLHDENLSLKKEIESLKKAQAKNLKSDLKQEITDVSGVKYIAKQVDLDANGMKDLAFQLGGEVENLFLILGAEFNGKALLTCYIDKQLAKEKSLNAGQIVRELGKYIQGGGGGQPFFATAGGKNPEGIEKALLEAKKMIS